MRSSARSRSTGSSIPWCRSNSSSGILLAGARFGANHRGGFDQHLLGLAMTAAHRSRFGRLAQSDLSRVRRPVRRHRHRFRHPVRRPLSRRTLQKTTCRIALSNGARHVGVPLTLAAAATAAGFIWRSSRPPIADLSELGLIAGLGIIVAFLVFDHAAASMLKLFNPSGEKEPLGYASLAPRWMAFVEHHRVAIIVGTAVISLGGLPLLFYLQFDLDPIESAQPEGGIGRHVPGAQKRSQCRRQRDRRLDARSRGRAPNRRAGCGKFPRSTT